MKGYIVEIDPQIEVALSMVMPGVSWKTWTPYFVKESDSLIDTWAGRVMQYLSDLPTDVGRISSRKLKAAVHADKVAPMTWTVIVRKVCQSEPHNAPNKETPLGKCVVWNWRMEGQSLVRQTAELYGFIDETTQSTAA